MRKTNLMIVIFVMICNLVFSQTKENSIHVYLGNQKCEEKMEIQKSQLLKESRLTVIANDKDTLDKVSFTLTLFGTSGDLISLVSKSTFFTPEMKKNIERVIKEGKTKKIYIEYIIAKYKEVDMKLPAIVIELKD
ncbi:MAG: hypothetical protein ACOYO1_13455 [Bacteroidales bacterium]